MKSAICLTTTFTAIVLSAAVSAQTNPYSITISQRQAEELALRVRTDLYSADVLHDQLAAAAEVLGTCSERGVGDKDFATATYNITADAFGALWQAQRREQASFEQREHQDNADLILFGAEYDAGINNMPYDSELPSVFVELCNTLQAEAWAYYEREADWPERYHYGADLTETGQIVEKLREPHYRRMCKNGLMKADSEICIELSQ